MYRGLQHYQQQEQQQEQQHWRRMRRTEQMYCCCWLLSMRIQLLPVLRSQMMEPPCLQLVQRSYQRRRPMWWHQSRMMESRQLTSMEWQRELKSLQRLIHQRPYQRRSWELQLRWKR